MIPKPILFILGPSGAGKTTLGNHLAQHGIQHINFDQPGDGVDIENLRLEWNAFLDSRDPHPLAEAIQMRIRTGDWEGASITCPSGIVPSTAPGANGVELSKEYLARMTAVSFRTVVLHGTRNDCLMSFLRRETETGRRLGQDWWDVNNAYWHHRFKPSDFTGEVLEAFRNGQHRTLDELLEEIQSRVGQ